MVDKFLLQLESQLSEKKVEVTFTDGLRKQLAKKGFDLDRRKIQIHEPLKTVGEFTVPIKLHKDVTTHLKVVIEKEAAEAQ